MTWDLNKCMRSRRAAGLRATTSLGRGKEIDFEIDTSRIRFRDAHSLQDVRLLEINAVIGHLHKSDIGNCVEAAR